MKHISAEIDSILSERFGKDSIIALATADGGTPYVRNVDSFYEGGAFYVLTHALSGKMQQIGRCSTVALAGEWFTGHGQATSLGWFCSEENQKLAEKMRRLFSVWIDNDHNDFSDHNTIILRIELTDGVLFSHGKRYEFRAEEM